MIIYIYTHIQHINKHDHGCSPPEIPPKKRKSTGFPGFLPPPPLEMAGKHVMKTSNKHGRESMGPLFT